MICWRPRQRNSHWLPDTSEMNDTMATEAAVAAEIYHHSGGITLKMTKLRHFSFETVTLER